jgi:CHAD domain-containing protein
MVPAAAQRRTRVKTRNKEMYQSKWISDLGAATPVDDAARRVLTLRLEGVRDCLGHALREPGQDPEFVHQLRVATRRASAALEIFAECLPPKVLRSARSLLRAIRRAAGKARDWDVFLARLMKDAESLAADDRAALDMLVGYALAHRLPAQQGLEESCLDYPFGFERCMAETTGAISYRSAGKAPLASYARPLLGRLFDELNRAAARDRNDYRNLHETRIVGKRLRYAIEMLVDCFGPALRKTLYPAIAEMQQVLGDVNDHFNAARLYAALGAKLSIFLAIPGRRYQSFVDRLKAEHERQLQEGCARFQSCWEDWQKPEIQLAIGDLLTSTPAAWHLLPEMETATLAGSRRHELQAAGPLSAKRTA